MTRIYTVTLPAGMLPRRRTVRTFESVTAFDGYIGALRQAGYLVTFTHPTACAVARSTDRS